MFILFQFDKASILGDTIEYLKELERRVEELESSRELMDAEARERPKHPDVSERTSDNYGAHNASKKRKACIVDEPETEQHHWVLSKDGPVDVNVTLMQKDVVIEMHCPWRDSLLFDIIEAMNNLDLDSHSLQSNTEDGILAMTAKAKVVRGKHRKFSPFLFLPLVKQILNLWRIFGCRLKARFRRQRGQSEKRFIKSLQSLENKG